jgi:hypothetical protein
VFAQRIANHVHHLHQTNHGFSCVLTINNRVRGYSESNPCPLEPVLKQKDFEFKYENLSVNRNAKFTPISAFFLSRNCW